MMLHLNIALFLYFVLVFLSEVITGSPLPKGFERYRCHNINAKRVEYDDRCSLQSNLLGCNAGRQGLNCRFCGFSTFPACPGVGEAEDIDIARHTSLDFVEGDILLLNKSAGQFYADFRDNNAKIHEMLSNQQDQNTEVFQNAVRDRRRTWDNGIIPFTISTTFDQDERVVILKAMHVIEDLTCIQFVPREDQKDYLRIVRAGGCFSYVGRSGGAQPLSLGYGCIHVGIAMHEMMHAIGFYHEQSRADRDQYVIIHWPNIQAGSENNFNKYTLEEIDHLGEPYNYASIMHYTATAFSIDGVSITIEPRVKGIELKHSAEKFRPSTVDVNKINKLYLCNLDPATPPPPPTKPTPDPSCLDRNELCAGWAVHGNCNDNVEYMRAACQKSCGFCKDGKLGDCENYHAYCSEWALAGQCDVAIDYMRFVCPKACKYCNPQCDAFREDLQISSRLQRANLNSKVIPERPQILIERKPHWPQ